MTQEYSLSAMRAFLAVARHLSFTAAARELEITQSAVSQRVQRLERQLGIGLFRRGGRGLELSSAGRRLAETGETAFSQIARVVDGITGEEAAGPVALGVLTSFANKWLIPRLGRFYADHPQIDLVVRSENRAVDLERESIDLALIFGLRPPPAKRLHSRLLMREKLFVVCAPEYLRRAPPLKTAADLCRHRLLHDHAGMGRRAQYRLGIFARSSRRARHRFDARAQFFAKRPCRRSRRRRLRSRARALFDRRRRFARRPPCQSFGSRMAKRRRVLFVLSGGRMEPPDGAPFAPLAGRRGEKIRPARIAAVAGRFAMMLPAFAPPR